MPILDASHDFAHEVEGDSAWSESYYFNAYDPAADAGFFTRIGVRPNEGTMDVGLSVWLPGNRIANVRGVREQHVMTDDDLDVGGVRYERVEPMRTWRTADADATVLDLGRRPRPGPDSRPSDAGRDLRSPSRRPSAPTVRAVPTGPTQRRPPPPPSARGTSSRPAPGRGRSRATATRGSSTPPRPGQPRQVVGPRRWGGPQMWRWFSVNIGDDVHFGGSASDRAGDLHRGWVWRDGEAASIRRVARHQRAGRRRRHPSGHPRAGHRQARPGARAARATSCASTACPTRPGIAHGGERGTGPVDLRGRTGYGISEYLHQLDDEGRALVPIE